MPVRRIDSLATRVLLWVAVASAVTFAPIVALSLWNEYRMVLQAQRAQSDAAVQLASGPLAIALWNYDDDTLRLFVDRLVDSGTIVEAQVREPTGAVRVGARRGQASYGSLVARTLPLNGPDGVERIGELVLQESLEPLQMQFAATAWRTAATELLKLLLLTATVVWVVDRLVLRRLRRLHQVLQAADPGDQRSPMAGVPQEVAAHDEIGALVRAADQTFESREALREAESSRVRAEAANRAKNEFISRVSHELRTPLNAILGFAQTLQRGDAQGSAQQRDSISHIVDAGWHLSHLIDDLLDLSRIEAGNLRVVLEPVAMGRVVDEALSMVAASAAASNIAVTIEVQPGVHARGDAVRLRQVLVNLLGNAVKYNRPQGIVTLRVSAAGGRVACTIADSGMGMSDAQLGQLFEPFNRLGRERSAMAGTGIGLVISRGLVEAMGGELTARSVEGQGSEFTVQLPAATVEPARSSATGGGAGAERPLSVLYVEDDEVNREVMRALLASRPRIVLELATTFGEAAARLARGRPDLLLLDMNLPDGNAIDFLRRLRQDAALNDLCVVVVSADATDDAISLARQAGAAAYLTKPLDFQAVLAQVDRLTLPAASSL